MRDYRVKTIASLSCDEGQRNCKELKHLWAEPGSVFAP